MAVIKKTVCSDMDKLELIHTLLVGMVNGTATLTDP